MSVLQGDSGLHDIMLVDAVTRLISSMAPQDHTVDDVASNIEAYQDSSPLSMLILARHARS